MIVLADHFLWTGQFFGPNILHPVGLEPGTAIEIRTFLPTGLFCYQLFYKRPLCFRPPPYFRFMVAASARPLRGRFPRPPESFVSHFKNGDFLAQRVELSAPSFGGAGPSPGPGIFPRFPGIEPPTAQFSRKFSPFGRAGRRERGLDGWSSHAIGAKRALFSREYFFDEFPLTRESLQPFPQIQLNLPRICSRFVQIRPDSYPILSAPFSTTPYALLALTLADWPDYFHRDRELNPGPEQVGGASLPTGPFCQAQFWGRPLTFPRKWYSSGQLPREIALFWCCCRGRVSRAFPANNRNFSLILHSGLARTILNKAGAEVPKQAEISAAFEA